MNKKEWEKQGISKSSYYRRKAKERLKNNPMMMKDIDITDIVSAIIFGLPMIVIACLAEAIALALGIDFLTGSDLLSKLHHFFGN